MHPTKYGLLSSFVKLHQLWMWLSSWLVNCHYGNKVSRQLLVCLFTGGLLSLGFAPFHIPGATIFGIALFYYSIQHSRPYQAFLLGFVLGLGLFGVGISWVSISIHTYGHLASVYAYLITGLFIVYLSFFPALGSYLYRLLSAHTLQHNPLQAALLFSSIWCITEYLRANVMTGFPWLLLGFGQIDTPLKYLLPITGIYGLSFLAVLAACCLSLAAQHTRITQQAWLLGCILILVTPDSLKYISWSHYTLQPISVAVIQANLSMRDKWDERLFWKIIHHYQHTIQPLLGKKNIIVLPEAAIPLPVEYIRDFLKALHIQAKKKKSAILFGIPEAIKPENNQFYNTLATLGQAKGVYRKQHLVPFGEYIPQTIEPLVRHLNLDMSNMKAGDPQQILATVNQHPFATLICYELAYPQILRQQLPRAEWIVSLSDDGWFGHSMASYQHLQMAQALSILTHRYQIVANNDGLSSIIRPDGTMEHSLSAFSAGLLEGQIYAAHGTTPWILWGDMPMLGLCGLIGLLCLGKLAFVNKVEQEIIA